MRSRRGGRELSESGVTIESIQSVDSTRSMESAKSTHSEPSEAMNGAFAAGGTSAFPAFGEGVGEAGESSRPISPARPGRALVVEAALPEGVSSIASRLGDTGFEVHVCADGRAAFDAFVRELPDLIVTRDRVGEIDGLELTRRVREVSRVPVLLVDPVLPTGRRERALRIGVDRVVSESTEIERLPRIALDLMDPSGRPEPRPRLTAAHFRRVARSERQAELARLLVECRGNLAEMARRLGKDRSTVRYHLRRFGMLVEGHEPRDGVRARSAARAEGESAVEDLSAPS
jgi:DNA-binding NarL/FixJ family response regulator